MSSEFDKYITVSYFEMLLRARSGQQVRILGKKIGGFLSVGEIYTLSVPMKKRFRDVDLSEMRDIEFKPEGRGWYRISDHAGRGYIVELIDNKFSAITRNPKNRPKGR